MRAPVHVHAFIYVRGVSVCLCVRHVCSSQLLSIKGPPGVGEAARAVSALGGRVAGRAQYLTLHLLSHFHHVNSVQN